MKDKHDIVKYLVNVYGCKELSFYNTPTNKQREKYWTFNRCLRYASKLDRQYEQVKHVLRQKNGLFYIGEFYELFGDDWVNEAELRQIIKSSYGLIWRRIEKKTGTSYIS